MLLCDQHTCTETVHVLVRVMCADLHVHRICDMSRAHRTVCCLCARSGQNLYLELIYIPHIDLDMGGGGGQ